MDLLEELRKIEAKAKNPEQAEKLTVEFVAKLDMKNPEMRKQAIERCKQILSVIEDNKEISSLEAKTLHCLITKIHLADIGLDLPFRYVSQEEAIKKYNVTPTTVGFYDSSSDSITFIDEFVGRYLTTRAVAEEFRGKNNPNKPQTEEIKLSKFYNVAGLITLTICHECQHAIQKRSSEGLPLDQLTEEGYIIDKQNAARACYLATSSKYGNDEVYNVNHDDFYIELDANEMGYERSLKLLGELSPAIYQFAAERFEFDKRRQTCQEKKESYEQVTWDHRTNPNNAPVSASHKATLIIDTLLPELSSSKRKQIFKDIPSLHLTYNPDGSKKTLEQIEKDREASINKILETGTPEEVKKKVPAIIRVYDTAIESDPVLSLERCLRQISDLTWAGTHYYVLSTDTWEDKYDYNKVVEEFNAATEKALKLVSYIEGGDYKVAKHMVAKCKKDLIKATRKSPRSVRFFTEKRNAFDTIEQAMMQNSDFKLKADEEKEDAAKEEEKKQNQAQAAEVIKKVFPDFTPHNKRLVGPMLELTDNVDEKLLLLESYQKYKHEYYSQYQKSLNERRVRPQDLLNAIFTFYDFNLTDEQKQDFQRRLEVGEISPLQTVYAANEDLEQKQDLPQTTNSNQTVENAQHQHEQEDDGIEI